MNLGIVSIQRNRAPWVLEWLAFHLVLGFNRFYLYAHRCSDGMPQLLVRLAQHYPIVVHEVPPDTERPQIAAYRHAWANYGNQMDWLAFIDGDEFLFPTAAGSMAQALQEYDHQRISAIGVYWVCFGSSGHVQEPPGLVVQNYRQRPPLSFPDNRHIKSIVRGRQASGVGPNSHMFHTPWGTQDELGRPVDFGLTKHEPSYTRFRINHYVTQSRQYFKEFKQGSGAADAGAAYVRPDSWWTKHDRNDELDSSLEHLVQPLLREMARVELPAPGLLQHRAAA